MAEELQYLIERIQKEAIEKAEGEAARIVAQAKEKAAALVKDAEAKARANLEKADRDAQVYAERSRQTLEQAARDLLITVGQGVEHILEDLVDDALNDALSPDTLKLMLGKMAEAYAQGGGAESRVDVLLNEADQADIIKFFSEKYREKMKQGVSIRTSNGILKGFRISFADGHVYHDFTQPAIAEALAHFLRDHLAEIVHRVARGGGEAPA